MKLENIRIVMVETTHPGNIGAAARAMNNMSLNNLGLVNPQCPIGEVAYARASGANAILDQRQTWPDLGSAIADCEYVFATSARHRSLPWPEVNPTEMVDKLLTFNDQTRVALVFGREHSGLTNEEIQQSNAMVCIPTNPDFSSLNIASAIQVLCYEVFQRYHSAPELNVSDTQDLIAPSAETEGYIEHLEKVLLETGYLDSERPGMIMQRLRRLYLRNELTRNEINILRGMLTAIEKRVG